MCPRQQEYGVVFIEACLFLSLNKSFTKQKGERLRRQMSSTPGLVDIVW